MSMKARPNRSSGRHMSHDQIWGGFVDRGNRVGRGGPGAVEMKWMEGSYCWAGWGAAALVSAPAALPLLLLIMMQLGPLEE